ncbi:MAG: hypothetical protein N3A63_02565 [Bacteroidetes bacterium]|nr:hypothetical protein [Bacteroidota bacterium]
MFTASEIRLLAERIVQLSETQQRISEAIKAIAHNQTDRIQTTKTEHVREGVDVQNYQYQSLEQTDVPKVDIL